MNIEEYIPLKRPIVRASAKSLIVPVVKKMIRYSLMKEEQIYNIDLFYRIREDRMKSTY